MEREGGGREREISKEEIVEVIKQIKDGKAEGVAGWPGEVWKHEGKRLLDWIVKFCNRI